MSAPDSIPDGKNSHWHILPWFNLLLLLALIAWTGLLSYYSWDSQNDRKNEIAGVLKRIDALPVVPDFNKERKEIMEQVGKMVADVSKSSEERDGRSKKSISSIPDAPYTPQLDPATEEKIPNKFIVPPIRNQEEFERAVAYCNSLPNNKERYDYDCAIGKYITDTRKASGVDPEAILQWKWLNKETDKATYASLNLNDPVIEQEAMEVIGEEATKYLKSMPEFPRKEFVIRRAVFAMYGDDSFDYRAMLGENLGLKTPKNVDMDAVFSKLKEIGDKRRAERNKRK